MYNWGTESKKKLSTCHPLLQLLMCVAIQDPRCPFDMRIDGGHRGKVDQHKAFVNGNSKLDWPNGNHNALPSLAVDVTPSPVDWNDNLKFKKMGEYILMIAAELHIPVIWGGNWKKNGDKYGWDSPHIELDLKKLADMGIIIEKIIPKE